MELQDPAMGHLSQVMALLSQAMVHQNQAMALQSQDQVMVLPLLALDMVLPLQALVMEPLLPALDMVLQLQALVMVLQLPALVMELPPLDPATTHHHQTLDIMPRHRAQATVHQPQALATMLHLPVQATMLLLLVLTTMRLAPVGPDTVLPASAALGLVLHLLQASQALQAATLVHLLPVPTLATALQVPVSAVLIALIILNPSKWVAAAASLLRFRLAIRPALAPPGLQLLP